jgi:hypothetical protein
MVVWRPFTASLRPSKVSGGLHTTGGAPAAKEKAEKESMRASSRSIRAARRGSGRWIGALLLIPVRLPR